jgi:methionyl-tRNA formyltransferase
MVAGRRLRRSHSTFTASNPSPIASGPPRLTTPYPTAFTYFRGKKLTIWRSAVFGAEHPVAAPGEIIAASGETLLVFCGGDSVLKIEELQLEGKRRMGVRDFINGVKPSVGDNLGI